MKEEFQNDPNFFPRSSQVMNHGAIDTILKLSNNQASRRLQSHLSLKKLVRWGQTLRTMLIYFFEVREIVHSEFVPADQTDNQAFYQKVLKRLHNSLRRKRPDSWDWFFHRDNAPAYAALSVRQFLTKKGMTTMPHPFYSPDIAPCYFFLLSQMKKK